MFLLVPVDATSHSAKPAAYESSHGPAPTCNGGNASTYQSAGTCAGKRTLLSPVHIRTGQGPQSQ